MEIQASGLIKSYGGKKVLKNIDITIDQPGVYLIAGPNGSGKTTFLEILVGLRQPNAGQVLMNQMKPSDIKAKQEVGFLTQQNTLRKNCTVREELTLVKELFKLDVEIYEYLKSFNLEEYDHIKTNKLSGGTKRRVLIAMLLMPKYRVLVLDEPVSGLDTFSRDEIWNMIRDYSEENIVITSDHYLNQASQYCDYIYLMNEGEIVLHGETDQLIREFQYSHVIKTRKNHVPRLKGILQNDYDSLDVKVSGSVYNLFTNEEWIRKSDKVIFSNNFGYHPVDLEDIYFYHTGTFVQGESV